ncbi:MAG: hypothetical protein QM736_21450 [Vicinamibacterales bacterium]
MFDELLSAVSSVIFLLHVQARQRLVGCLHAELFLAGLHHAVDLVNLVVANQVPDRGRRHHDLERRHTALAVGARQQRLTDDPLEHERELRADLSLLSRGEDVDDAVDGLRRGVRMQRAEREVPCLGDLQRRFHGFEIAHLADEDDVRIFAERGAERVREAVRVAVHLALVHEAVLVRVDVLDRILDGEDVIVPLAS